MALESRYLHGSSVVLGHNDAITQRIQLYCILFYGRVHGYI